MQRIVGDELEKSELILIGIRIFDASSMNLFW